MAYQLQFNVRSGSSLLPKWEPMPEGRGEKCATREQAENHRRSYVKAWRRLAGCAPQISLRIAKVVA